MINYAANSDLGHGRENNEDYFLAFPERCLWILADGVGGHEAGEIASKLACEVIAREVVGGSNLEGAICAAHKAILEASPRGAGRLGMASTVVVLLVDGSNYQISWVGDSRCYVWSRHRELRQLTRDHSLVQCLVDDGVISKDQAVNHPRKNIVTQVLGQIDFPEVQVETVYGEFQEGEQFLMCSDGLTDYVIDADINELMSTRADIEDKVNALVLSALDNQANDNITVVLIDPSGRDIHITHEMEAVRADQLPAGNGKYAWTLLSIVLVLMIVFVFWYQRN